MLLRTLVVLAIACGVATNPVDAASLTHNSTVEMAAGSPPQFNISVFPGAAGYEGLNGPAASGMYGDGTIVDYRFFNNAGTTFNSTGYADGGAGIVGPATATNSSGLNGGALDWANAWTVSDPNSQPADFTSDTVARSQGVTGTIDISGLGTGSIDFIYGSFTNPNSLDLVMSGAGQPDILASHTEDPVNGINTAWTSEFLFENEDLLYDTITYTYTNTDTDGSRARLMGLVVDGAAPAPVPEPATILLWSLVGITLAGFRRWKTG